MVKASARALFVYSNPHPKHTFGSVSILTTSPHSHHVHLEIINEKKFEPIIDFQPAIHNWR